MNLYVMGITPIVIFNGLVWVFFTFAYFYQIVYLLRVMSRGDVVLPKAKKNHRYAFVIPAHNEESVIGNLVHSILTKNTTALSIVLLLPMHVPTLPLSARSRQAPLPLSLIHISEPTRPY